LSHLGFYEVSVDVGGLGNGSCRLVEQRNGCWRICRNLLLDHSARRGRSRTGDEKGEECGCSWKLTVKKNYLVTLAIRVYWNPKLLLANEVFKYKMKRDRKRKEYMKL
jgi:hypothetical protein